MEKHYDLIVVGGGVTGAGIALDASSRGLATLLLEKKDFASGTSSKSTKLIHGGLRYLKQFEIGLVRETGTERAIVHHLAPHLVHPEKMLLPIVENGTFGKWSASIAISVYDYLAGVKPEDRKVGLTTEELLEEEPLVKAKGLNGGMMYSEYRTDDARLTMALVKAAVRHGADAYNHCALSDFLYQDGKVVGVRCIDHVQDREIEFKATHVVSAAGPWVDQIRALDGSTGGKSLHLTKGVHIVVPHKRLPINHAVYFDAFDGRMMFAIPRGRVTYVGTSDTTYAEDLDRVLCTRADAEYIIGAINNYFDVPGLGLEDVISSWAGLRPLIHEDGKSPSELSRKDEIFEAPSGLISIAGGKLTGYRKMAQRIVDLVISRRAPSNSSKCQTASLSLQEPTYPDYAAVTQHIESLAKEMKSTGLEHYHAWYLVTTYGRDADLIWSQVSEGHGAENMRSLLLEAELEHCLASESIYYPQDFLNRRTGALYFDIELVNQFQNQVTTRLGQAFDWSSSELDRILEATIQETKDCLAFLNE